MSDIARAQKKYANALVKLRDLMERTSIKIDKLNAQASEQDRFRGVVSDADTFADYLQDMFDDMSNVASDLSNVTPYATQTVDQVAEFHQAFDFNDPETPFIPEITEQETRGTLIVVTNTLDSLSSLIKSTLSTSKEKHVSLKRLAHLTEELGEFSDALLNRDLVKSLDALEDLEYVLMGSVCALGMRSIHDVAFNRVHASNMSKLKDGKPVKDATGKVVKGNWYVPVDLKDLIDD